jgi:hypothetical protein
MKYGHHTVNPAYDVIEFWPLVILILSWSCYSCEVCVLPDFRPTDYLFEAHSDKGQERWEVMAWAVRDVIVKAGGFQECNQPLRQKFKYEKFMQMRKGATDPSQESGLQNPLSG